MTAFARIRDLRRLFARFSQDKQGMSAVEFAMLLPMMVTLYLGVSEVSQGVGIDRKVTLTSRTVADLASQATSINNAGMTNILNASASVVAPYDVSKVKVVVSAVTIDNVGTAKIAWSDTLHGTARSVGATVTVPPALKINNTTLVWGEVTYNYVPTIGYVITGPMTLSDQLYMRPRLSDTIARVP